MFEHRKKILVGFLVLAIIIAFFLTYRTTSVNSPNQDTPPTIEVKGNEVVAVSEIIGPYDDSLADDYLELTAKNVIWFTNYYRVKNGIKPLKMVSGLNDSAHAKSMDMFKYGYFDHTRLNGKISFDTFIDDQEYDFIKVGENLARGDFETSRDVVDAWMNSSGHRKNILDGSYVNVGVSVDQGKFDDIKTLLITQHFGLPKSHCPLVSKSAKTDIEELKAEISNTGNRVKIKEGEINQVNADDDKYNSLVEQYNELVNNYNRLTQDLQKLAGTYNEQVRRFDACVKGMN